MTSLKAVPRNKLEAQQQEAETVLAELRAKVETIRTQMQEMLKEPLKAMQRAEKVLTEIRSELYQRRVKDAIVPTITDHALLRYIERVHGIDMDAIRETIMTDVVVNAIKNGVGKIKTTECEFVVKDMAIVTVYVNERPAKPKASKMTRAKMATIEYEGDE